MALSRRAYNQRSYLMSRMHFCQSTWIAPTQMAPMQVAQTPFMKMSQMRKYSTIDTKGAEAAEVEAKASAREFMEKAKEESYIDEITMYDQWQTKVMDVKDVPIILDCYADWC